MAKFSQIPWDELKKGNIGMTANQQGVVQRNAVNKGDATQQKTEESAAPAAYGVVAGAPKLQNNAGPVGTETKQKTTYTVNANNEPYVNQLNSLYDAIMNRKPFQYDLNGDLLYRQMADQYAQMGQMAMRDTMGQASALTGGYGNSYAQQVGNQAYQQYMTALNEQVPSLYDRALQAYLAQGDQMLQQYQLAAAHPGTVEAIKPQTYEVTQKADDFDQATYNAMVAGILAGNQVNVVPYEAAGANTTVTPETVYNPAYNPLSYGNIYYNRLLKK